MDGAVNAVLSEGLSIRHAAEQYTVPKSSLGDRMSGRVLVDATCSPATYLSARKEEELVTFLTRCASIGYAKSRKEVLALVQRVLDSCGIQRSVTNGWWESFRRRHPNLTLRSAVPLSLARAKASDEREKERTGHAQRTRRTCSNKLSELNVGQSSDPAGEEVHIQESNSSAACVQAGVSRSGLVDRSRGQVASRAVESGQQGTHKSDEREKERTGHAQRTLRTCSNKLSELNVGQSSDPAGEEVHIQESNSSAACVQTGVSRSGLVGRTRGQVASRTVESGQQGTHKSDKREKERTGHAQRTRRTCSNKLSELNVDQSGDPAGAAVHQESDSSVTEGTTTSCITGDCDHHKLASVPTLQQVVSLYLCECQLQEGQGRCFFVAKLCTLLQINPLVKFS